MTAKPNPRGKQHPKARSVAACALLAAVSAVFLWNESTSPAGSEGAGEPPYPATARRFLKAKKKAPPLPSSHKTRGQFEKLFAWMTVVVEDHWSPVEDNVVKYALARPVAHEASHDDDELCIAHVDDGNINSAAVVQEDGQYHLSLPDGYEARVTFECTRYQRAAGGADETSFTSGSYAHDGGTLKLVDGGDSAACDPKGFQPGHYDARTETWHEHCTGECIATGEESNLPAPLTSENCPLVAARDVKDDPVWVLFVGDSVMKQIYLWGLPVVGIPTETERTIWNYPQTPYYFNLGHEGVWLSFKFTFVAKYGNLAYKGKGGIPRTWGEFVAERGEGPRDDDPPFPEDKVPDVLFFSPGYHASELHSAAFGTATEKILLQSHDDWVMKRKAPMPRVHLLLNLMPASWLIPNKYAEDRIHRTMLNEYRKNLALLNAVGKFDFVRSVVDIFSPELPLNAAPHAGTGHLDAVHMSNDAKFFRPVGRRIVRALCSLD